MPIRRNAAPYPADWKTISRAIRARAGGRCECVGECGLHRNPVRGGPRRCTEWHGQAAQFARGKVVLTTAHLNAAGGPCRCDQPCGDPLHLKAMCNRCHLRYDVKLHVANARATRRRKAREAGQMEIPTT